MAYRSPAAQYAARHPSVVSMLMKSFSKDKKLLGSLALAFAGIGVYTAKEFASTEVRETIKQWYQPPTKKTSRGKLSDASGKPVVKKSSGAAIDKRFLNRLLFILKILLPTWRSKEVMLLLTQSAVLVSRSLLSLRMARLGGDGLKAVLDKNAKLFGIVLTDFFVTGLAASVVNSALKYLTNSITVAFRQRLTTYVHDMYLVDNSYYKAAVLRLGNLDNADQRIVEDLNQFCGTLSDLIGRTFKPALDVVLSSHRMSVNMGWKGLAILYTYFVTGGALLRKLSPPFASYIGEIQKREGNFRSAHSRLIANAEEVAFLHGSDREKEILNRNLCNVTSFSEFYFLLQFRQGCVDQLCLKYFATIIGWPIIAIPFLNIKNMSVSEVAANYRESDTLIQAASSSIGDLMLVYKKLQRLAGFTTRVVELIEMIENSKRKTSDEEATNHMKVSLESTAIRFKNVTITAPDGRQLLRNLNLELRPGENVLVTGPNGAGKTSLFRCLAGLWSPAEGDVIRPANTLDMSGDIHLFYVPQRPYLVTGNLRDQVLYPLKGGKENDAHILACLEKVGLTKLVEAAEGGL
eukprot:CAMPEP_0118944558 /NCGR_PEP_ID=MMETSP1169-20130426/40534_1 /TAXON_ID=36882 /ORGANISM="Pyramimonas obovata, Strain CCMP722" /LENGTH=576 /DNA_ID=CAMNT_0006890067 /DNA_START=192 /DNA_END=1918 /DNA_ORIENTATION=-